MAIKRWHVQLDGLEELVGAIDNATEESIPLINNVVKNHTEKASRKARQLAPVDTWFMHDNITTDYEGENTEIIVGIVESQAGYSGFVEFGTRYMFAQPFMHPAIEYIQPLFTRDLKKVSEGLFK